MKLSCRARLVPLLSLITFTSWQVNAQSVEEVVATAFNSNPELQAVYHKYRASEQSIIEAKANWYPSLDVSMNLGTGTQDVPESRVGTQQEDIEPRTIGISIQQLLFDGFFTSANIRRTEHETLAEFYQLQAAAENTALEVTGAYLALLEQQQLKELAAKNLKSHQDIYEQIKERTESGLGSASDLSQASGRLAKAHANLITAENNLQDAVSAYQRVVGTAPEALVQPVADKLMLPLSLGVLRDNALASHPIVKSAKQDIKAAKAEMEANQNGYYPRVTIGLGQTVTDDGNNPDIERDIIRADLNVSYNLFRGGADKAREIQSAYNVEEAKQLQVSAQRQVIEGADFSWNAYTYTKKQLAFLQQHVEQSYLTQQAYQQQFNLGRRTLLDLLDTENELFEARRSYVAAETKYLQAIYRVLNASGRLLDSLRIDASKYWQEVKPVE